MRVDAAAAGVSTDAASPDAVRGRRARSLPSATSPLAATTACSPTVAPAAIAAASAIDAPAARSSAVAGTVGSAGSSGPGTDGATTGGTSATTGSGGGRSTPPVGSSGRRSRFGSSVNGDVTSSGIGAGRGSFSAARTRLRPNSAAVERSAGSGRPARSRTAANGPRSADTGISRPTRADSVATVERAANGTAPVTASTRMSANE